MLSLRARSLEFLPVLQGSFAFLVEIVQILFIVGRTSSLTLQPKRHRQPTAMTEQGTNNVAVNGMTPGVCGPHSEYIILKSKDGHEFYIARKNVTSCKMIEGMLSGPGEAAPDEPNEVR